MTTILVVVMAIVGIKLHRAWNGVILTSEVVTRVIDKVKKAYHEGGLFSVGEALFPIEEKEN